MMKLNFHAVKSRANSGKYALTLFISVVAQLVIGCSGIVTPHSQTGSSVLSITTTSVPSAKQQSQYSVMLTATGGKAPYTWSLVSGSLPTGLNLAGSGAISGMPSQSGNFSFTAKVADSSSPALSAQQELSITVSAATNTIQITTNSIPSGQVGVGYSDTLAVTGGTSPYTWTINSGTLPTGLTLNAATGLIAGTPSQSGSFSFTVQVKDSSSPAQATSQSLSITIAAAAPSLSISTTSLTNGTQSAAYSATLKATGGTTPYTWSISSGLLPSGVTLNSATGVISGTLTQAGTFFFTAKVVDSSSPSLSASANLSIEVTSSAAQLQIATASLPAAALSTVYNTTLAATGGTAPYIWSVLSGSLPAGLTLSTSGQITGTPTTSGSSTFSLQVKDSSSPTQTASKSFTISVAASGGTLQLTTVSLPNGQAGVSYSSTLTAIGGVQPYTWSITSGTLPTGLALSSAKISGTPTQSGTSVVTLQVQDSSSTPQKASKSFSIAIAAAVVPVSISTGSLASGQVSSTYAATLAASGGTSPYTWSVSSGALPAGLSLSASSGQISGTPTQSGTSTFTVQVKDSSSPAQTATKSLSITIAATPVQITTASVVSGQAGTVYSATLAASGGTTPYSWSISSGALPSGLTLSSAGTISGTPTASGSFGFTAKVTDSTTPTAQTATKSFSLTVAAAVTPLQITTTSVPSGQVGTPYSTTLAASGGTTPYSWSISSGALPAGLTLSATGTISGTPTASGSFSFTAKVTDSTTPTVQTATKSFSLTVAAAVTPLQITTSTIPAGQVGAAYSTQLTASGGTTPYTWSLSSGALPAGMNLTASTGAFSGTPTTSGSFTFTVKVTDSTTPTAQTATKSVTFTVAAAAGPVQITTTSVPAGQTSVAYTTTLTATSGTTPYTWSINSGSLPAGLTLSSAGTISGTPTATGTSNFTVKVTDSSSPASIATASFSITVAAGSGYSVLLNWTASPSAGVTGYNVYRSTVNGSGYAKINSSPLSGLTCTDSTVVASQTYYYVTTAVDNSGDESGYSDVLQMVIP
jgi:Putative Ig domain